MLLDICAAFQPCADIPQLHTHTYTHARAPTHPPTHTHLLQSALELLLRTAELGCERVKAAVDSMLLDSCAAIQPCADIPQLLARPLPLGLRIRCGQPERSISKGHYAATGGLQLCKNKQGTGLSKDVHARHCNSSITEKRPVPQKSALSHPCLCPWTSSTSEPTARPRAAFADCTNEKCTP